MNVSIKPWQGDKALAVKKKHMKFTIQIIETLGRKVEIEAENYAEAKNEVERMYYDEEVVLTAENHTNTEFEQVV